MNWGKSDFLRDRAAVQVEISRLRRLEAKADDSMRTGIVRRIRELQSRLHGDGSRLQAEGKPALEKTA